MRAHLAKEIGNLQRLVSELAAEVEDAVRKAVTAARERDDAASSLTTTSSTSMRSPSRRSA